MTAQRGKDLLLKLDSDGLGDFITVAGLRARGLAFNAAAVDVTHAESSGEWRELLAGAGLKTARVTGGGIFKDEASDAKIRELFFAGAIRDWQMIIPHFGVVQGCSRLPRSNSQASMITNSRSRSRWNRRARSPSPQRNRHCGRSEAIHGAR